MSPTRLELLREMHCRDPRDGFVAYGLALELAKTPLSEAEAVATFRRLLEERSDYLPAYLQFGMLLTRRGEPEEARKVYDLGLAIAAREGDAHTASELQSARDLL